MFASSSSSSSSSAVLRRQGFLVRAFTRGGGGGGGVVEAPFFPKKATVKMQQQQFRPLLESDAAAIIRRITPPLSPNHYKGQAGKVAVIGGCREYTGAPYFAAISALRLGADLSHVFCTKDASPIIKSYSPELIVHPILEESYNMRDDEKPAMSRKVLSEITKWVERFDCLVVGPGLGRDEFLLECVSNIIKHARQAEKPIVFDADGLFLVTNNLDLIKGYPLAVLTPNVNEYKRLVEKVLGCEVDEDIGAEQLLSLARRIGGATIFRKGKVDLISDGHTIHMVSFLGSPRRCGGQGDILSGSVGIFSSWARQRNMEIAQDGGSLTSNPVVLGCMAGSTILRKAASMAFARKKRATLTSDIIECLGESMEILSPTW